MLPSRQLGRNVLRVGARAFIRLPVVYGARFQSTATPSTTTASETNNSTEKSEKSNQLNNSSRPRLNPKLREIRNQVEQTIKLSENTREAYEIFEEGVAYLRDIQPTENIDDFQIYTIFQKLGVILLEKLASANSQSEMSEFLDVLIKYRVAHGYHFFQVMKSNVESGNYQDNLRLWVKYLEACDAPGMKVNMTTTFRYIKELNPNYNMFTLRNIVFYSYYVGSKTDYEFNLQHLLSLLQMKELPIVRQAESNIRLNHIDGEEELAQFRKYMYTFLKATQESQPNSVEFMKKIDSYVTYDDRNGLSSLFERVKDQSLSMPTLQKFMASFTELELFDYTFKIMGDLLKQGTKLTKPMWDIVIKAMGHSENIKNLSDARKKALGDDIERVINSMTEQGIDVDAKILSTIVASFSNLNDFARVNFFLEKYKNVPVIQLTKNNYLHGLILNGKIDQAESKLKEYLKDKNYIPSVSVMNSLMNYYSKQQNLEAVTGIIEFMGKHGIAENVISLTIVTDLYFKVNSNKGKLTDLEEILGLFKGSKIKLNLHTYTVIIDGLIKNRNLPAARAVFNDLTKSKESHKKPSAEIITAMIKGELEFGNVSDAEDLFEKYLVSARNDTRVWNMMIAGLLNKNETVAITYFERLKQQHVFNVKPNFYTYYYLFNHFIRKNNKEMIKALLQDLSELNLQLLGGQLPKMITRLEQEYEIPQNIKEML